MKHYFQQNQKRIITPNYRKYNNTNVASKD